MTLKRTTMTTTRKRVLAVPVTVAAMALLVGCSQDSAGPEQGVDVEDVAEAEPAEEEEEVLAEEDEADVSAAPPEEGDGGQLVGQTVTVSGEVSEVVDQGAFRIGGDGLGADSALVVSSTMDFADMGVDVDEEVVDSDTVLQVTGTVREFVLADFEEEFGVDYDDELYADFEGEAVIVAEQVATLPGESITIAGEVSGLLSTVAFQLTGAGWTVVVLDAEQAAVDQGEYVQVQGTVRQLDIAELEAEFGMDLDDALYEPFVGDLVLVADNVTPTEPTEQ